MHGISLITMSQLRQSLHLMPQSAAFLSGLRIKVSPIRTASTLFSYNIRISSAVLIPLSETNTVSAGAMFHQSDTVSHINGKIMEIPVVHSHDFAPDSKHGPLPTDHELLPEHPAPAPVPVPQRLLTGCYQESHKSSTQEAPNAFCLVEHVLIYCKILSKHRNIHCLGNFLQIPVCALEIKGLCEAGDCRSTGLLIFLCNVQIRKIWCDQSF